MSLRGCYAMILRICYLTLLGSCYAMLLHNCYDMLLRIPRYVPTPLLRNAVVFLYLISLSATRWQWSWTTSKRLRPVRPRPNQLRLPYSLYCAGGLLPLISPRPRLLFLPSVLPFMRAEPPFQGPEL